MKKLFISQPMRGLTDGQILAVRAIAKQKAENKLGESVEVIDSFFQSAPTTATPLWYLGESLKLMSTADVVYFVYGWEQARGCRIEHDCARAYDLDMIEE